MKKKLLLSPLLIVILLVLVGIGVAGAAILVGTTLQGETNTLSVNLQKGLVGHWKLNGNANDATPQGNNGTVTGATLTTDRKGQNNKAYDFNGTSDNIAITGLSSYFAGTNSWTIVAWVNADGYTNQGSVLNVIVGWGTMSAANNGSGMYISSGNIVRVERADGTTATSVSGTTNISGSWHLLVGTYDGTNMRLYVDGTQEGAATASTESPSGTANFNIARDNGAARYFDGKVDDVRIYNRALSAAEATALYQEYDSGIQIATTQKGLVGNWTFDGDAKDRSSNENNGTVTGATLNNDRKGQAQKSYDFNGTSDGIAMTGLSSYFTGTNPWSISAWVYADGYTNQGSAINAIAVWGQFGSTTNGVGLSLSSANKAKISRADASTETGLVSTTTISGGWHHIAGTYDGTNIRIYVDGTQEGATTASSESPSGTESFRIGRDKGSTRFFDGRIDDARIYSRALTATEITTLYGSYNPGIQVSNLSKGLVGWWSFDGNAKDRIPYENNGTVTGAALTADRKGQVNKAYSFVRVDASNGDYIKIGDPSSGVLDFGTGDFTISLWLNITIIPAGINNARFLAKGSGNATTAGYSFFVNQQSGAINFNISDGSGGGDGAGRILINGGSLAAGWHHIVGRKSGTTMELFYDTVSQATATPPSGSTSGTSFLNFGALSNSGTPSLFFTGSMDDIRIYNRALTATEITQLYQSY